MRYVAAAAHVRLAQLDRAFGYGPKGRGFESSSARYEGMAGMSINATFPRYMLVPPQSDQPVVVVFSCPNSITNPKIPKGFRLLPR